MLVGAVLWESLAGLELCCMDREVILNRFEF